MPVTYTGPRYAETPAATGRMLKSDDTVLNVSALLEDMLTAMQNIDIDIDSVNINTDEVESILDQIRELTIDANNILAASAADLAAIEALITAGNAILTTIDADTGSMLLNQTNKTQMAQITDGTDEVEILNGANHEALKIALTDGTDIAGVIATILSLKTDLSSVAGTVTDVDQGNASAGSQRVVLATDDYAVVALQLIDDCIGTIDAAFSGKVAVIGAKAESTVPTEVADADAVAIWADTFGRLVQVFTDLATQTAMVTDASPAQMQKMFETGWAALTAPDDETPELNVRDYENLTFTTVVDIGGNDSVDVIFWGSIDGGTNWFQMGDTEQYTASGTYAVTFTGVAVERVKVEFDAEAGDTDATVTPMVGAGN